MTKGLARVISIDEAKISNDIDQPVLITPGVYEAVVVDWKVNYNPYFRRHILRMHFRIVAMGPFHGVILPAWFNVKESKGKTTVKAGWKSDFLRMYQACFDIKLERKDRIPMSSFDSVLLKVEVMTIAKDTKGQPLAKINQYSRVKRCIEVMS